MWRYSVDRKNKRLEIRPLLDNLVIDKVTVNGSEIENDNFIYDFTGENDIDVRIEYTVDHRHGLVTHYDAMFNRNMHDSELSLIQNTIVSEEKIDIYNISGMQIRHQCDKSELNTLPTGVYIIRQGNKIYKKML